MQFPLSAPHYHTTLAIPCRSICAGWLRCLAVAVTESGEHFALSQEASEVIPGALGGLAVNRGYPGAAYSDMFQRSKNASYSKLSAIYCYTKLYNCVVAVLCLNSFP